MCILLFYLYLLHHYLLFFTNTERLVILHVCGTYDGMLGYEALLHTYLSKRASLWAHISILYWKMWL